MGCSQENDAQYSVKMPLNFYEVPQDQEYLNFLINKHIIKPNDNIQNIKNSTLKFNSETKSNSKYLNKSSIILKTPPKEEEPMRNTINLIFPNNMQSSLKKSGNFGITENNYKIKSKKFMCGNEDNEEEKNNSIYEYTGESNGFLKNASIELNPKFNKMISLPLNGTHSNFHYDNNSTLV